MNTVKYSSNNSGGSWWLNDDDWRALAAAGWDVAWRSEPSNNYLGRAEKDGRWMGALATSATRTGLTLRDAILEWERATGEDANALGCSCCGTPHDFIERDNDGHMVNSYSPEFPTYGTRDF